MCLDYSEKKNLHTHTHTRYSHDGVTKTVMVGKGVHASRLPCVLHGVYYYVLTYNNARRRR